MARPLCGTWRATQSLRSISLRNSWASRPPSSASASLTMSPRPWMGGPSETMKSACKLSLECQRFSEYVPLCRNVVQAPTQKMPEEQVCSSARCTLCSCQCKRGLRTVSPCVYTHQAAKTFWAACRMQSPCRLSTSAGNTEVASALAGCLSVHITEAPRHGPCLCKSWPGRLDMTRQLHLLGLLLIRRRSETTVSSERQPSSTCTASHNPGDEAASNTTNKFSIFLCSHSEESARLTFQTFSSLSP